MTWVKSQCEDFMTSENVTGEVSEVGDVSQPTSNENVPVTYAAVEEKQVPQSAVNDIVGSVRTKAHQKGREEAQTAFQSQFDAHKAEISELLKGNSANAANNGAVTGEQSQASSNPIGHTDINKIIAEKVSQLQQEQQKTNLAQQQENALRSTFGELANKLKDAEKKHEDFNDVTNNADFMNEAPELLIYANSVDNAADVLYNLASNPSKIGSLKNLSPRLAQLEINRLSQSLKQNESATNTASPHAPLSQLKSSNIGGDNGKKSMKDLREYYARKV